MSKQIRAFCILTSLCLLQAAAAAVQSSEPGIPIDDKLVLSKCGGCHPRNSEGMMRRISYMRTTPEIWDQIIKRMVRLNGLNATPPEVRQIVRYLSANNGLAPEEQKPIFWEVEHRLFRSQEDEMGSVPDPLQHTCNYCHTLGRVLSQRRTRSDYEKLANMHMALFPGAESAAFRPVRAAGNMQAVPIRSVDLIGNGMPTLDYPIDRGSPGTRYPIDNALDYLGTHQPLITPEWTAWKSVMQSPKLAGTWLINGYQKGQGRIYGQMTITAGSDPDEFTTRIEMHFASSGKTSTRTGKGLVYTGYSWRGRSNVGETASGTSAATAPPEIREALMISRDGSTMEGRWFWGGYQELGVDVQLIRLGSQATILGTDLQALKSPSSPEIRVFGGNLPSGLKTSDVDLGPGIKVEKVISSTPTEATLQVAVSPGLVPAQHDISIAGATALKSLAVYDKVAYIKVAPDATFSRLGGTIAQKQFAQFEAIAFSAGPDGKSGTADDISLGPVSSSWSLEEFYSTPNDDDVKYVGTLDDTGLFTPAVEGPNPKRKKQANNFATENWGDVWVSASYQVPDGGLLKARSYLVVTVPEYVIYDQPEVSQ